jgi:hypothetical protein
MYRLSAGPDGKTSHNIGRACICWNCGHVGLPSNRKKCSKDGGYGVKPKCAQCKEKEQTNWIRVTKDGKFVPFLEIKSVATKEAIAAAAGAEKKVKRNDKCPCKSGKKYKKCCLIKKVRTKHEITTNKTSPSSGSSSSSSSGGGGGSAGTDTSGES